MQNFKPVIGLEIHTQLNLKEKMFSPERFDFGALQNTLISEISLGYPGTLPVLNMDAFKKAITLGLACNSKITRENYFSRKNYFYPDLPKGYQITQDDTPICKGGFINYEVDGIEKQISLTRIHIEEDAAKLQVIEGGENYFSKDNNASIIKNYFLHDKNNDISIDFNRSGVALLEIVTEPEFNSGYEVFCFLHELRRIVRYLNISNGNMEEGSMRCDANISVMPKDSNVYGQRVEVKNMNSIKNVQLAIEYEIERQIGIISQGKEIIPETRMFDSQECTTKFQRLKEKAADYKYFQEPDLNPVRISDEMIEVIRKSLSVLPYEYKKKLVEEYSLTSYQADVLIEDKELISFYEMICGEGFKHYKTVANWVLGPVKGLINELKIEYEEIKKYSRNIRELILMVLNSEVSYSVASQNILKYMLLNSEKDPHIIATKFNFLQNDDKFFIEKIVEEVLKEYPNKVLEYKNGKNGLLGFFVGETFKRSENKANPKTINDILLTKLKGIL